MKKKTSKVLLSTGIGSIMEFYDFCIYIFFAPILAQLFFPTNNPLNSLLAAFGVFAVGFFMRPFGALSLGRLGDRIGRKKVLVLSILLMGVPTFLVGFLPTYESIGICAPIILIVIRLLQGMSGGGEVPGSCIFVGEHADPCRLGLFTSLINASNNIGLIVALGIGAALSRHLSSEVLYSWGWRVPFWIGGLITIVGYYLRKQVPETRTFLQLVKRRAIEKRPFKELFKHHRPLLLKGCGFVAANAAAVGLLVMYLPTYLSIYHQRTLTQGLWVSIVITFMLILFVPIMGTLSDRWGRKKMMLAGSAALALFSYPLFKMLTVPCPIAMLIGQIGFALIISMTLGTYSAALIELFPPQLRFSGFAFAYNITYALFIGAAPLVATGLIAWTNNLLSPSIYLIACGICTFFASVSMKSK